MNSDNQKELLKHTSKDVCNEREYTKICGYLIDASISDCHNMKKTLENIVKNNLRLVITSISLEELDRLQKKEPESEAAKGARYILRIAAENLDDAFDVVIIDRDYHIPDDAILKYCIDNKEIGVITSDKVMALKARAFGVECIYLTKDGLNDKVQIPLYKEEKILPKGEKVNASQTLNQEIKEEEKEESQVIESLPDAHIEETTNKVYIYRENESSLYKRHIYRGNPIREIEVNSKQDFFIQNDDEIFVLSYEITNNLILFEHYKVVDETSLEKNVIKIFAISLFFDISSKKFSKLEQRYKEVIGVFFVELKAIRQNCSKLSTQCTEGIHYYTTRNSGDVYRILMNVNGEVLPYDVNVELNFGDTILELNFNEKKKVSVLLGRVIYLSDKSAVILKQYNGKYSLEGIFDKIKIMSKPLNDIFIDIVAKYIPPKETLVDLPNAKFKNGNLWASTSFNGESFYQLYVNGMAKGVDTVYPAIIDSFMWEITPLHDNIWLVRKYVVRCNTSTNNSAIVFSKEIRMNEDGIFEKNDTGLPVVALDYVSHKLFQRNEENFLCHKGDMNRIYTMPYSKVHPNGNAMITRSSITPKTAVLVYKNGFLTIMDKEVSIHKDDFMLVIVLDKKRYFLSEFVLTDISEKANCVRKVFVHGWVNKNRFQATNNKEINELLSEYLPQIDY